MADNRSAEPLTSRLPTTLALGPLTRGMRPLSTLDNRSYVDHGYAKPTCGRRWQRPRTPKARAKKKAREQLRDARHAKQEGEIDAKLAELRAKLTRQKKPTAAS